MNSRQDLGILVLRLSLATVFLFHGAQKLFGIFGGYGIEGTAGFMESLGMPFPTLSAIAAGGTEFVGGLALVTGLFVRPISIPLAFTMFVAAFAAHGGAFSAQAGGMEYPLTLALGTVAVGLIGPGRFVLRAPKAAAVPVAA